MFYFFERHFLFLSLLFNLTDVRLLLRLVIFSLLGLAVLTFVLNSLGPIVTSWWIKMFPKPEVEETGKWKQSETFWYSYRWHYVWCNLGKSVWSRTCDIFSVLFDWSAHLERYILLKTPPELDQRFQSYQQLNDSQNNRKQKKFILFSGYISQSMLPTSDWLG